MPDDPSPKPPADPIAPKPAPPPSRPAPPEEPPFPVRDPGDLLDPGRLAQTEMSVGQLIEEGRRVIRLVRPAHYREYGHLIARLATAGATLRDLCAAAAFASRAAQAHLEDLKAIKPKDLEGVRALDEARRGVGESWQSWRGLSLAYAEVIALLATLQPRGPVPGPAPDLAPDAPPRLV